MGELKIKCAPVHGNITAKQKCGGCVSRWPADVSKRRSTHAPVIRIYSPHFKEHVHKTVLSTGNNKIMKFQYTNDSLGVLRPVGRNR